MRSTEPLIAPRTIFWFGAGFLLSAFLIATQALVVDGLPGLLLVGEMSPIRPFIESYLGEVPLAPLGGHDGQIYFAIAHDLDGNVLADLIDQPGIRFRRPILPLVASMGGVLEGSPVLWSTAFWISAGFGASALAFRDLIRHWGVSSRWMLVLFAYPGFWLAVRLFTPDMIALGAALVGLALFLRGNTSLAIALFSIAALTKEPFVVVAVGVGAWAFLEGRRRTGFATASIPSAILLAYSALVLGRFDVETVDGNWGLPFRGIWEARSNWTSTSTSDQVYLYLTLVVLALGVVTLFLSHDSLLKWLIAPWPLIGIISSDWIWDLGNGVARSFAPVTIFMALAIGTWWKTRSTDQMSRHPLRA